MNTVWDGLEETRAYDGHVLWLDDDFYVFPNALLHLDALIAAKAAGKCPDCSFVSLGPDVRTSATAADEDTRWFVVEKRSNDGMAYNRTIWNEFYKARKVKNASFSGCSWDLCSSPTVIDWLSSSCAECSPLSESVPQLPYTIHAVIM